MKEQNTPQRSMKARNSVEKTPENKRPQPTNLPPDKKNKNGMSQNLRKKG